VRFGMELVELTDLFADSGFKAFAGQCVKGIRQPGGSEVTSRKRLDDLTDQAKRWGAKGLVWMRVTDDGLESPVAKFLSEDELAKLREGVGAEAGDLLLLVAADRRVVRHVLGLLRLELGRPPVTEGGLNFLWVLDFPLFEGLDEDGRPVPAHHPFTMPHPDDLELLASGEPEDLLRVRSQAYDLVLNGWELGSGSVRIHRADVQRAVFRVLGISDDQAHRSASGSCWMPSATGPHPTRASRSGSTGWWRCWSARRTSARSSPSPRPSRAPIR
jgi:aspartyl-tRNA synthetase